MTAAACASCSGRSVRLGCFVFELGSEPKRVVVVAC